MSEPLDQSAPSRQFRASTPISADPVYQALWRLIIEGQYAPGEHLVEERLAQDLGVSRTPVRQALARAAAEGLVRIFPHRGAVVRTFTHDDVIASYDLRALLESYGAFSAAQRITPQELEQIEYHATILRDAETQSFASHEERVHYLVEHNQEFHDLITHASGNGRLHELNTLVINMPLQFRSFYWHTANERHTSNFFHFGILHALQNREPDRARAMMREHILVGRDFLLRRLGETEQP